MTQQATYLASVEAYTFAAMMVYGTSSPDLGDTFEDGTPLTSALVLNYGDDDSCVISMKGKTTSDQTFCELKKDIQELLNDGYTFRALYSDENDFNEWDAAVRSQTILKLKESIANLQQELKNEEKCLIKSKRMSK